MEPLLTISQLILGLGILNVWLLRRSQKTAFRGGSAKNMTEEFEHYGLPKWSVIPVGVFKVGLALTILAGFYYPPLAALGATGLALFMLVAVAMHLMVHDSFKKTLPSLVMLGLCLFVAFSARPDIVAIAVDR